MSDVETGSPSPIVYILSTMGFISVNHKVKSEKQENSRMHSIWNTEVLRDRGSVCWRIKCEGSLSPAFTVSIARNTSRNTQALMPTGAHYSAVKKVSKTGNDLNAHHKQTG